MRKFLKELFSADNLRNAMAGYFLSMGNPSKYDYMLYMTIKNYGK